MKTKKLLLAVLMATCLPALADAPAAQPAARTVAKRVIGPLVMHHGRVVENAPYSARVITEKVQNLPDGNQISNQTTAMTYRDSAGRTRHEMADSKGEVLSVAITDPNGPSYILRPKDKTATKLGGSREKMKMTPEAAAKVREAARARIEQLRKEGKLPAAGDARREAIIVKRVERVAGGAQGNVNEEVRLRLNALGSLRGELSPLLAGAFRDRKWAESATTRELGSREIEGVKADGKMRSYDIPAGEVGNRNPITVTHETWRSPELQVTVYTKHSDPRTGDSTYRLDNIKREEPAASLFAVPSDYTVTAPKAMNWNAEEKQ
ncbi:MAG: hypothetical protein ACXWVG_00165 [Telluria sp.]